MIVLQAKVASDLAAAIRSFQADTGKLKDPSCVGSGYEVPDLLQLLFRYTLEGEEGRTDRDCCPREINTSILGH